MAEKNNTSLNEWNSNWRTFAVIDIVLAEEGDQMPFFICQKCQQEQKQGISSSLTHDSAIEEFPKNHRICHKTDFVAEQNLRSQAPPEEPKVRRMSREGIHPVRHQDMVCLLGPLNDMVEVRLGLDHGSTSKELAETDTKQT